MQRSINNHETHEKSRKPSKTIVYFYGFSHFSLKKRFATLRLSAFALNLPLFFFRVFSCLSWLCIFFEEFFNRAVLTYSSASGSNPYSLQIACASGELMNFTKSAAAAGYFDFLRSIAMTGK